MCVCVCLCVRVCGAVCVCVAAAHRGRVALPEVLRVAAADAQITHTWGGVLGIPRDFQSSVGLDRRTGLGWAGGYVGDGVAVTNLAGRTLADLILQRDTDITTLPWVNHRSRKWEPEPARWIAANGSLKLLRIAETQEETGTKTSRAGAFVDWLTGH